MRTTTGPASPHVSYASMTPSCVWQRRAASFDMLQAYTRYPAVLRSVVRRCCGVCTLCTAHDDRALRQARFRSKHLSQEGRQANFSTSQVFQSYGLGKMVAAAFHNCQVMRSASDSRPQASRMYTTGVSLYNALAGGEGLFLTTVPVANRKLALTLIAFLVLIPVICHAASRLSRPSQQRQFCRVCHQVVPGSASGCIYTRLFD